MAVTVTAADFRQGEKVVSPVGVRGVVRDRQRGTLTVEYADRDQTWLVSYSPAWFEKYGHLLQRDGR